MGINTTLRYKKLALNVSMNGAMGQDIYNNTLNGVLNLAALNGGRNIAASVFENPTKEAVSNRVTASSRYIEKGDYLKMNNATLSYTIGNLSKTFKGVNLFVTGQNLFVITNYSGFDPEVNVNKSVSDIPSLGIDYTAYPSARTILFGLNFSL